MLEKRNMNKRNSFNIGGIICLIFAVYSICYLLIQGDFLPFSIQSVLEHINHWAKHYHVLAVALLPIYVGVMIFGTAIMGVYLGSALQRWLTRFFQ